MSHTFSCPAICSAGLPKVRALLTGTLFDPVICFGGGGDGGRCRCGDGEILRDLAGGGDADAILLFLREP